MTTVVTSDKERMTEDRRGAAASVLVARPSSIVRRLSSVFGPPSSVLRPSSDLAALALVGVVAAGLRLAFLYRAPVFLSGDSQSHFLPGFDLAHGLGFDPELRRPPGYALFVAGVIAFLGEDLRALAFAQHVVGTTGALLTYALGRLTFGRPAGLIGGLLVALDGALILSEHSVMTEALFGTLILGSCVAILGGIGADRPYWRSALLLLGGLVLGLATLTRPVAQILVPLVPLVLLLVARPKPVTQQTDPAPPTRHDAAGLVEATDARRPYARLLPPLRASAWVWLGFLVVVGPWSVRNLVEHGSLTASGGLGRSLVARTVKYDEGFFGADRPPAGPDDLAGQVRQFIRGKRNTIRNSRSVRSTQAGLMTELGLTQARSDGLMRQMALEEIRERPGYYALGSLRMAGQILAGKEKEDALLTRWNERTDKDWVEQWEARIDHLVTPTTPAEQRELARANALVHMYQPAALGPIMPLLALLGLVVAAIVPRLRPALLPGLAAVALVLASAFLDGPVPRYRYPVDPLIALFAVGGVLASMELLAVNYRRWSRRRPPEPRRVRAGPASRQELLADR